MLITIYLFCFQRPHKANGEEMTKYHSDDYIKFLRSIRPDNMSEYSKQMQRCECQRFFWLTYEGFLLSTCKLMVIFCFFCPQSMLVKTVQCLMVCLSSASSQRVDLLVCYHSYSSHNSSVESASHRIWYWLNKVGTTTKHEAKLSLVYSNLNCGA